MQAPVAFSCPFCLDHIPGFSRAPLFPSFSRRVCFGHSVPSGRVFFVLVLAFSAEPLAPVPVRSCVSARFRSSSQGSSCAVRGTVFPGCPLETLLLLDFKYRGPKGLSCLHLSSSNRMLGRQGGKAPSLFRAGPGRFASGILRRLRPLKSSVGFSDDVSLPFKPGPTWSEVLCLAHFLFLSSGGYHGWREAGSLALREVVNNGWFRRTANSSPNWYGSHRADGVSILGCLLKLPILCLAERSH